MYTLVIPAWLHLSQATYSCRQQLDSHHGVALYSSSWDCSSNDLSLPNMAKVPLSNPVVERDVTPTQVSIIQNVIST
jgi:hypothetical protein